MQRRLGVLGGLLLIAAGLAVVDGSPAKANVPEVVIEEIFFGQADQRRAVSGGALPGRRHHPRGNPYLDW